MSDPIVVGILAGMFVSVITISTNVIFMHGVVKQVLSELEKINRKLK